MRFEAFRRTFITSVPRSRPRAPCAMLRSSKLRTSSTRTPSPKIVSGTGSPEWSFNATGVEWSAVRATTTSVESIAFRWPIIASILSMTRIFSDAFPSWPHRSGAFTCRTTRSWVRNASIAASAFAIMSVSRPPVAPRTSMTSIPKVRNTTATRCSVPSRTFALIRPSLSPSSAFASSSVPSRIRPARRSVSFRSSSTEAKFPRKAMSPGSMSMPTPAASNGPRPVYTAWGSYPKSARWLVSLPAATPGAIGSTSPFTPFDANQSRFGFGVASSGVLWPSSMSGRSPRPSKITRRILRASISAAEGPVPRYVFPGGTPKSGPHQRFREDICRRSACSRLPEASHGRDRYLSALWRAELLGEPVLLELRGPAVDVDPAGDDSDTVPTDVVSSAAAFDGKPDRRRGGSRDRVPRRPGRRGGRVGRAAGRRSDLVPSSRHGGPGRPLWRRDELDSHNHVRPHGPVSIHGEVGDRGEWRRHRPRPDDVRFPQLRFGESRLRPEPTGRPGLGGRPAPRQHNDGSRRGQLPDLRQHVDPRRRPVAVKRSIYVRASAFATLTGMPGVASSWPAALASLREISRNPLEERVARRSPGATTPYVLTNGTVIS